MTAVKGSVKEDAKEVRLPRAVVRRAPRHPDHRDGWEFTFEKEQIKLMKDKQ